MGMGFLEHTGRDIQEGFWASLINFLLFQLGWFGCVLSGAAGLATALRVALLAVVLVLAALSVVDLVRCAQGR